MFSSSASGTPPPHPALIAPVDSRRSRGERSARPSTSSSSATTVCATRSADRRHPEHPRASAMRLRYLHRAHRRRELGARGHPIPDLVKVVLAGRPRTPRYSTPSTPGAPLFALTFSHASYTAHFEISNGLSLRLQLAHATPPQTPRVRLIERTQSQMTRPLRSTPITGASPLLRAGPPAGSRNGTHPRATRRLPPSHPPGNPDEQYRIRPSPVPCRSRRPGSRRLYAGHRLANQRAPARLIPGSCRHPGFDVTCICFDTSTAIRSRSPSRSPPDTSHAPFPHRSPRSRHRSRSMWRFEASPAGRLRRADNPSSPAQHRFTKLYLHRTPFHVRDTPTSRCRSSSGLCTRHAHPETAKQTDPVGAAA